MTDYSNLPAGSVVNPDVVTGSITLAPQSRVGGPRHLAHPLRLVDGPDGSQVFATVEQDTLEEVTQSVKLVLSTETGERYRDAPEFGVDLLLTGDPVSLAQAEQALAQLEPRAQVRFTTSTVDGYGQQYVRADVSLAEDAFDVTPELDH